MSGYTTQDAKQDVNELVGLAELAAEKSPAVSRRVHERSARLVARLDTLERTARIMAEYIATTDYFDHMTSEEVLDHFSELDE